MMKATPGPIRITVEEQEKIMAKQKTLCPQTLERLDPSKLTPLSPEVISRQATINIGTFHITITQRNHWTRCSRKIHSRQSNLWSPSISQ